MGDADKANFDPEIAAPFPEQAGHLAGVAVGVGVRRTAPDKQQQRLGARDVAVFVETGEPFLPQFDEVRGDA